MSVPSMTVSSAMVSTLLSSTLHLQPLSTPLVISQPIQTPHLQSTQQKPSSQESRENDDANTIEEEPELEPSMYHSYIPV